MATENQTQEAMFVEHQQSVPKATQGIFDLPCGYLTAEGDLLTEVKVREITGAEEDMLAAKNITGGKKVTQLIASCLERLGPIMDGPSLANAARGLVVGDRVFLMMAIRRVTLGDEFPFEAECIECKRKSLFMVNLSELDIKKTPDPKKRIFSIQLPSGKTAQWHVMTGKEEESAAKWQNLDQMSLSLLLRVDMLDGGPPDMDLIKTLSMRDRNALRDAFESVEGGIETELELSCPACGTDFKTELDVGQTGFFFPSRVLKNLKRSTSSFSKPGKDTPTRNS